MLNRLLLLLVSVAAVLGGYGIWQILDVSVSKLVIEGDLTEAEQDSVRSTVANGYLGGILTTDLHLLESELDEMRWARSVDVRRVWPSTILVRVMREKPMAKWGDKQYISASGHLLTLPNQKLDIPRFDVSISSPHRAMEVYRLLDQIASREDLIITLLGQDPQGGWHIEFENNITLALGSEQLNKRMHRFLLLHRRVLLNDDRAVQYVDARYSSGIAVKYAAPRLIAQELSSNPLQEGH